MKKKLCLVLLSSKEIDKKFTDVKNPPKDTKETTLFIKDVSKTKWKDLLDYAATMIGNSMDAHYPEIKKEKEKYGTLPKGKKLSGHYWYKGHDIYFKGIRDLKKQIKAIDIKCQKQK